MDSNSYIYAIVPFIVFEFSIYRYKSDFKEYIQIIKNSEKPAKSMNIPELEDSLPINAIIQCQSHSLFILDKKQRSLQVSCPICYTIFDSPRTLTCKHTFCGDCIKEWSDNMSKKCPLCRVALKKVRGNYGRCNQILDKKIAKLMLKCVKCKWQGTRCDYLCKQGNAPFLDDCALLQEQEFFDKLQKVENISQCEIPHNQEEEKPELKESESMRKSLSLEVVQQVEAVLEPVNEGLERDGEEQDILIGRFLLG